MGSDGAKGNSVDDDYSNLLDVIYWDPDWDWLWSWIPGMKVDAEEEGETDPEPSV